MTENGFCNLIIEAKELQASFAWSKAIEGAMNFRPMFLPRALDKDIEELLKLQRRLSFKIGELESINSIALKEAIKDIDWQG